MFNIETLRSKSLPELTKISKDLGVKIPKSSTKDEVVFAILDFQASNPKPTKEYYNATETTMEENTPKPAAAKATKAKPKAAPKKTTTVTEPKKEEPKEGKPIMGGEQGSGKPKMGQSTNADPNAPKTGGSGKPKMGQGGN